MFQLLQGYVVLALSLLLWKRYVPTLLPTAKKQKTEQKGNASLQRLLGYMKPFSERFAVVFFFVVISSLGKNMLMCCVIRINERLLFNFMTQSGI